MIVVADSGPIHYLILLEQVELLHRLYGQVIIPGAVQRELSSGGAPQVVSLWLSRPPVWLRVESVPPDEVARVTDALDLGEREAIVLTRLLQADLLLMDDFAGRAEARRLGLRATGTLGVLRAAAETGLIDVVAVINRLRATNFYVDERLVRAAFAEWLGGGSKSGPTGP